MEKGDLLDVGALKDDNRQNEGNFVDVYVQSIALKYPMMANRFKKLKTMDKLHLLRRIAPVLGNSPSSMHEKMQSFGKQPQDYMGDPVTKQVLKHYGGSTE
jgi:hypothetical protein